MQSHNKPKKKKDNSWKSSEIVKSSIPSDYEHAKEYFKQHREEEYLPYSARLNKTNLIKPRNKESQTLSLFNQFPTMHSFFKLKGEIYRRSHTRNGFIGAGGNGKVIQSYKGIMQENENIKEELSALKIARCKKKHVGLREREAAVLEDVKFSNTNQSLSSGSLIYKKKYYTHMHYTGISFHSILAEGQFAAARERPQKPVTNVVYLYLHENEIYLFCKLDENSIIEKNIGKRALGTYYKKYYELLSLFAFNNYINIFIKNLESKPSCYRVCDLVPFHHEVAKNELVIYFKNNTLQFAYHDNKYSRFNKITINKNIDNYASICDQVSRIIKTSVLDSRSGVWLNSKFIIQHNINTITKKNMPVVIDGTGKNHSIPNRYNIYLYKYRDKVYCAYQDSGNIKKQEIEKKHPAYCALLEAVNNPSAFMEDEEISIFYRESGLPDPVLTDDKRLSYGIDICLDYTYLHSGRASLTGKNYAHLDPKPENLTLDTDDNIHIIDYGATHEYPDTDGDVGGGTPMYLPDPHQHRSVSKMYTKEQRDMLGIKRTLIIPQAIYCCPDKPVYRHTHETFSLQYQRMHSLLTPMILDKYDLNPYINTYNNDDNDYNDFVDDYLKPVSLAAILINARLNLQINNKDIKNNLDLSKMIASKYDETPKNQKLSPQLKKIIIDNKTILETLNKKTDKSLYQYFWHQECEYYHNRKVNVDENVENQNRIKIIRNLLKHNEYDLCYRYINRFENDPAFQITSDNQNLFDSLLNDKKETRDSRINLMQLLLSKSNDIKFNSQIDKAITTKNSKIVLQMLDLLDQNEMVSFVNEKESRLEYLEKLSKKPDDFFNPKSLKQKIENVLWETNAPQRILLIGLTIGFFVGVIILGIFLATVTKGGIFGLVGVGMFGASKIAGAFGGAAAAAAALNIPAAAGFLTGFFTFILGGCTLIGGFAGSIINYFGEISRIEKNPVTNPLSEFYKKGPIENKDNPNITESLPQHIEKENEIITNLPFTPTYQPSTSSPKPY